MFIPISANVSDGASSTFITLVSRVSYSSTTPTTETFLRFNKTLASGYKSSLFTNECMNTYHVPTCGCVTKLIKSKIN